MNKRFQPHPHPNAYGVTATEGDRSVDVLRAYPGDWRVFASIDGVPCGPPANGTERLPHPAAMRLAIAFLDGRVTPEVHS